MDRLVHRRRGFLRKVGGTATLAITGLPRLPSATARNDDIINFDGFPFSSDIFSLGVASGDPLPESVVLWTRLAPDPLAKGGGLAEYRIPVHWRVATDPDMDRIVRTGTAPARPEDAHSIHVDVKGLEPATEYYYQFEAASERSPVGRTKTAPAAGTSPGTFEFAFVSCQNYPFGYYTPHRHLAEEELDLVVYLGDYIYEGGAGGPLGRGHEPSTYCQTLADYRTRHAQYKTDPALQAAHAVCPWIVTWDDHEVVNNYADDEYRDVSSEALLRRRANAYQAYWEHLPLRPTRWPDGADLPLYRRFTFGDLVEFNVLDTRQYRDDQPECFGRELVDGYCPAALDSERTILGDEQEQWLVEGLEDSTARWNVLAQQVIFAQTDDDRHPEEAEYARTGDKWDGYKADRDRLLEFMATNPDSNPVVITGDSHRNWVFDLKADFSDSDSRTVGTEFAGTSLTSFGDGSGQTLYADSQQYPVSDNPHQQFYNDDRGYVRCEITPDQWRTDFRVVSTVEESRASIDTLASFAVEAGTPGAKRIPE